jgi:hypothetical protein
MAREKSDYTFGPGRGAVGKFLQRRTMLPIARAALDSVK